MTSTTTMTCDFCRMIMTHKQKTVNGNSENGGYSEMNKVISKWNRMTGPQQNQFFVDLGEDRDNVGWTRFSLLTPEERSTLIMSHEAVENGEDICNECYKRAKDRAHKI